MNDNLGVRVLMMSRRIGKRNEDRRQSITREFCERCRTGATDHELCIAVSLRKIIEVSGDVGFDAELTVRGADAWGIALSRLMDDPPIAELRAQTSDR